MWQPTFPNARSWRDGTPDATAEKPLGNALDAPVMLLKCCIGNRALGWDLLPPGSALARGLDRVEPWGVYLVLALLATGVLGLSSRYIASTSGSSR